MLGSDMNFETFDHYEDAEKYVSESIGRVLPISPEQAREITTLLVSEYIDETQGKTPPGGYGALIPPLKWVIRNDDLQFMKAVFSGLQASASAGFFSAIDISNPATWGAVVAVAAIVYRLYEQAATKGKQLKEKDFQILLTLKKNPNGLDLEQLAEKLRATDTSWLEGEIEERLNKLQEIPTTDGTLRRFVVQEDGRWRPSGI